MLVVPRPYTFTDQGTGFTADSLATWRRHRSSMHPIVRAEITRTPGAIGAPLAAGPHGPIYPTLILSDATGSSIAFTGMSCGTDDDSRQAAAMVLSETGMLDIAPNDDAATDGDVVADRIDAAADFLSTVDTLTVISPAWTLRRSRRRTTTASSR